MRELPPEDRRGLAPLFERQETLRAVVDAVLEGRLGRARVSAVSPRAARLSLGCYDIFGGDPDPAAAAELSAGIAAPRELVFGNDAGWKKALTEAFGAARVADRPMQSFASAPSGGNGAAALPLPDGFAIVPIDARLAAELGPDLSPHAMQVFENAADFARRGAGFAVVRGEEIASAATSYALSSSALEVAISTKPAYRGLGLAFAVAQRLLSEAAARGLAAHWNASNPVSQRLAMRLGLEPGGICEVLVLA